MEKFTPITQHAEHAYRVKLIKQMEYPQKMLTVLSKFINTKNSTSLEKIITLSNISRQSANDSYNKGLDNFLMSPMGKDLRRNISYLMIARSINEISSNIVNVAVFFLAEEFVEHNSYYKWFEKIIAKLNDGMKKIVSLLKSESLVGCQAIIKEDKSINKLYKDAISKLTSISNSIPGDSKKNKDLNQWLMNGFILSLKSFEHAGDAIKEIAYSIAFIATGNFEN